MAPVLNRPPFSPLRFPLLWVAGLLGIALLVLPPAPPAQAGVFSFLLGGRENRGGRVPNRQQGGGVRAGRVAGGFDATLPYIISPRNTFEASDRFTIRWHPVDGVETYTVRLWQWQDANGGRQRILWETTTSDAAVVYGGDPSLAPESFYSVEVITDQGVTSDLDAGCAIAGFAVLFPETRSRLEADLASLNPATLTPEELALAKAQIYLAYQMLNAAIDSLATQAAADPTATLALALGDLYSFAGLNTLAAEQYSLALALAPDDPLWQAIALEGLGELAVLQNDIEAALPPLRQAQFNYDLADNGIRANQVETRIALLQKAQQLDIPPTDDLEVCEAPPG